MQLEAYSDPEGDSNGYSQITFCNLFFNAQSLSDAVTLGKAKPGDQKYNLENYDNRGTNLVFF